MPHLETTRAHSEAPPLVLYCHDPVLTENRVQMLRRAGFDVNVLDDSRNMLPRLNQARILLLCSSVPEHVAAPVVELYRRVSPAGRVVYSSDTSLPESFQVDATVGFGVPPHELVTLIRSYCRPA